MRLNAPLWRTKTAMITMRSGPCGMRSRPPPRIPHGLRCPSNVRPVLSGNTLALLYCSVAGAASAFSALAFYAASPHCRWPRLRRAGRLGRQIGLVAAATSLWLWMGQLGLATGLCVTLAGWMLTALILPYLAAWTRPEREARP
ncbi:hypothetical protein ABIA71_001946 [Stenotrophomonas sp. 2619]